MMDGKQDQKKLLESVQSVEVQWTLMEIQQKQDVTIHLAVKLVEMLLVMALVKNDNSTGLRGWDEEHLQCVRSEYLCKSFVPKDHFQRFREVIEFQKAMGRWPYP